MKSNNRLKIFICSLWFLAALMPVCLAGNVTVAWDPVTVSTLSGYKVYYGTQSLNYGSAVNVGNTTSHTFSGLQAGTYYFAVTSYDSAGYETEFSREAVATITAVAPVISSVTTPAILNNGATVSWKTDIAANSQVEYGPTTSYGQSTPLNASLITSHAENLTGLAEGTTYHYRVKSANSTGSSSSGDFSFTTLRSSTSVPLAISGVTVTAVTSSTATITWVTNQASNSQVQYGLTTGYGSSSSLDTAGVTTHSILLTGLYPKTTYHYRVLSRNSAGQSAVSGDFVFRTARRRR